MYEFFTGTIAAVHADYLVMTVQGIGYKLIVPNPYRFTVGESTVTVYVEQTVRDNIGITLYGFSSLTEKQLFQRLTSVTGIGPKSALAILATGDAPALVQAIQGNDVQYLTHFPGIGKKSAQQIILQLADKLGQVAAGGPVTPPTRTDPAAANDSPALTDALAALTTLGYNAKDVARVAKSLREKPDQKTDDYIRLGLRLLTKTR
ncbi:Holliday junction branch migration protein RuvA [Schleiferilactobacillus perolens]|jgi:Holliday junction DNA helicase RuvA|uniref:Holliday junction branch migration complex subunit RuvA n=1 Tax=Schleiferilactobacillus perolens DSM 12744 TaxID=1423792 RepID=A0A0R1N5L1_9LACO|nr:Holliday junction branch migration protein RuvA [Schleiferilactobacillus perolens]KRL12866.1 holliday junction DNA helicase RuvA [Schleiferilactobacillus perolens DSM 12744]MCI1892666.1 Holliday junction branch migration protein RuvA [Schleiferilactobacillus harbinensis]MCI1913368.1 Holliday junction branch migration protein RuvA [Schleiferilactobacillus harbinensis]MCI2172379.1 Holliday junction branch migration protein RuvA [Schleiferilactobacillus perolens]